LIINDENLARRAEILWEKGTNRSQFMRNEVGKYTWIDVGSSFLPSETTAAFLLAQLEEAEAITEARRRIWNYYQSAFAPVANHVRLAVLPDDCRSNGHIFYMILPNRGQRDAFIEGMRVQNIATPFHYVPLHSSPGGQRFGRSSGNMKNTDFAGDGLVRLPLFPTLSENEIERVVSATLETLAAIRIIK
jgi:dTDP-4-amino-4,6-dideoxygalactose transaminase